MSNKGSEYSQKSLIKNLSPLNWGHIDLIGQQGDKKDI
jgi:hypothetical protein